MGAEVVMDLAEARAPGGFADVEAVLPRREREERAAAYRRLSGLDVQEVNGRPSLSVRPASLAPSA